MAASINCRRLERYEINLTSELCIDNNKKKYEIKLTSELCIDNNKKKYEIKLTSELCIDNNKKENKWCKKCTGEG